jgi:dynein light chain 4
MEEAAVGSGMIKISLSNHGLSSNNTLHSYALIRHSDMSHSMRNDTLDLCVAACGRHGSCNEAAARAIKEGMDRRFGGSWHAVVGEGFGMEISHEERNLLYMFFDGTVAVCVWRCA